MSSYESFLGVLAVLEKEFCDGLFSQEQGQFQRRAITGYPVVLDKWTKHSSLAMEEALAFLIA